ncbi:hypothetical protein KSF78_0007847 [Schistosoma japonicum]|nr:hypothetical protein KSF78_0007847 [Schistosoma japonicum]
MIHLNYTFNIVQSVIGQLSSDHSNIIGSLTPLFGIDSLLEANNNTNCSSNIEDPLDRSNFHIGAYLSVSRYSAIMLLLRYGVVALKSRDQWYHVLIKDWLSIVTTIVAMILGGRTKVLSVKWRKILFTLACLFTLMGIIFTILGFVFRDSSVTRIVYQVFACASWCFVMFIVDFWSMWYLLSRTSPSKYTFIFAMFLIFYEFVILDFILQLVFAITVCERQVYSFDYLSESNPSLIYLYSY